MKAKNILRTLRKIINYIQTHEEGFIVYRRRQNAQIEAHNQLARLVNRISRRGSNIHPCNLNYGIQYLWHTKLGTDDSSGIAELSARACADRGKIEIRIKPTDSYRNYLEKDGFTSIKHGAIQREGGDVYVVYEGDTVEEVLDNMNHDCFVILPDKKFTPADRKRIRKIKPREKDLEAVLQRFLDQGIIQEEDVNKSDVWDTTSPYLLWACKIAQGDPEDIRSDFWDTVSDEQLHEALHDPEKLRKLVARVQEFWNSRRRRQEDFQLELDPYRSEQRPI